MFKFSKTSRERLETCDGALIQVMEDALRASEVDFGIAEGHRSKERQMRLFMDGKTKIDGVKRKGKHNHEPSQAVDIYAWVNGKSNYKTNYLLYLGGIIKATGYHLGVRIRSGFNFDQDGELLEQSFDDLVHHEIK